MSRQQASQTDSPSLSSQDWAGPLPAQNHSGWSSRSRPGGGSGAREAAPEHRVRRQFAAGRPHRFKQLGPQGKWERATCRRPGPVGVNRKGPIASGTPGRCPLAATGVLLHSHYVHARATTWERGLKSGARRGQANGSKAEQLYGASAACAAELPRFLVHQAVNSYNTFFSGACKYSKELPPSLGCVNGLRPRLRSCLRSCGCAVYSLTAMSPRSTSELLLPDMLLPDMGHASTGFIPRRIPARMVPPSDRLSLPPGY